MDKMMNNLLPPTIDTTPIAEAIKEKILRFEFHPKQRLTEDMVCSLFKIGRSRAREALLILLESGLLEKIPYKGYTVAVLNKEKIAELYQVRLALELFVVSSLCDKQNLYPQIKIFFKDWTVRAKESLRSDLNDNFTLLDREFHEGLAKILGNKTLFHHLQKINDQLIPYRFLDFEIASFSETIKQHRQISLNIIRGEKTSAKAALNHNFEYALNNIEKTLKKGAQIAIQ